MLHGGRPVATAALIYRLKDIDMGSFWTNEKAKDSNEIIAYSGGGEWYCPNCQYSSDAEGLDFMGGGGDINSMTDYFPIKCSVCGIFIHAGHKEN